MAWNECASAISAAAKAGGLDLSQDDLEAILNRVSDRFQRLRASGLSEAEGLTAAGRQLAEEAAQTAAIEKRNALLNLAARQERRARIEAAPTLADGIRAEIHGINTPVAGGRFSAEAEWKALNRVYQDGAIGELERAGLFKPTRDGALEREWARELFELSKGDEGKPGVTGSKEALGIAEILHRYQTMAKDGINQAGGWVGDYSGYITRTDHDADKIRRAGFDAWRDGIDPKLDPATFEGVEDRQQFLQRIYNAFVSGVHLTDGVGFKDPAFSGPANLAEKLSRERVLHFKDADSWLDYHKQFGSGTVIEAVLGSLDRSARATALMRRWGTNPRAEFENDLRYLAETYRDKDPGAVDRLGQAGKDLQNRFDNLDGTANMPVNRLFAKISSAIRVEQSMSKLGGVLFTHLSVGATKAAELRYQGIGLLDGYRDFAESIGRGRGTGETRQIMDLLHAGMEGMHGDILARFDPDDGVPGTLSKLANTFFKWTGLTYMFNAQKAGAEFVMARHLGSLVDQAHDALPAETRAILKQFGIGPAEWELLRQAPDLATANGRTFLTPDAARRVDPAAAEALLRQQGKLGDQASPATIAAAVAKLQDDLAIRLHAYFNDRAERAMITPGIAERSDLLRGTRPGTPEGELLRFLAQFKMWPAAMIRQGWGREIYGRTSAPAAMAGILHMTLGATVFGYLRMVASDLSKGRNPRDPSDPKTWVAAMVQGGGVGILGDYLFGEYNRFGQNFVESLAGPVLGQGANTLIDLWNKAKEGKDLAPEAFQALKNNTPFVNLFYTRLALDYFLMWHVQEALSPGYLRRSERRIQQQNHQDFWLRPSQAVTGGGLTMPTFGG